MHISHINIVMINFLCIVQPSVTRKKKISRAANTGHNCHPHDSNSMPLLYYAAFDSCSGLRYNHSSSFRRGQLSIRSNLVSFWHVYLLFLNRFWQKWLKNVRPYPLLLTVREMHRWSFTCTRFTTGPQERKPAFMYVTMNKNTPWMVLFCFVFVFAYK